MSDIYNRLGQQVESLVTGHNYWVTDLANAAACLYYGLSDINWVGFYLQRQDLLLLGPFQGKPACTVIPNGKGVCGTAAATKQPILVPDVHEFPGHIACDPVSRSELVVPLVKDGIVLGVLDVDSPLPSRFGPDDADGMCGIARILVQRVNWEIDG